MPKGIHASRWRATALAIALAVGLFFAGAPARAQVKPGDLINAADAYKVKALVSPGVYYKVVHGMTMKITPSERIDWPPPFRDATEKYADQVRLSPNGRTMVNYVAGQPFPFLDPNDPHVASKIVWNAQFRPITSDDYDLRYFDCDTVRTGLNKPVNVLDYFQIGHYAGYDEVGRTEVDPIPIDPDYKVTNRYSLFGLYPILAPEDLRGTGLLRFRYENPKKADDIWDWNPGDRRLRRLNEGIMGDSVTPSITDYGSDMTTFDPDHYSGFNAKVEEYNYKFLGQKTMLASVNAAHSPEITCQTDGGGSACTENWEPRQLYIVQAEPRGSNNSQALQSKTIMYIDGEMWFEPYVDEYDQQGQLWTNQIYWLTYRDRPVPDARIAIYPFKREFVVGAASTDEQSGVATMCYLPGQDTPEHECWYINMGAVDRSFFTPMAMALAAR
jgi:hypothetical protein